MCFFFSPFISFFPLLAIVRHFRSLTLLLSVKRLQLKMQERRTDVTLRIPQVSTLPCSYTAHAPMRGSKELPNDQICCNSIILYGAVLSGALQNLILKSLWGKENVSRR